MRMSKGVLVATMVVALAATSVTAFAATYSNPAEIAADVTGRTLDSVVAEHVDQDKTYGTIAKESGDLDAFKAEMLKAKRAQLDERVAAGTLTKERADEIYAAIEKNQANCDGTGQAKIGRSMGAGFGKGTGMGGGRGGNGFGQGAGLRDGSCLN